MQDNVIFVEGTICTILAKLMVLHFYMMLLGEIDIKETPWIVAPIVYRDLML